MDNVETAGYKKLGLLEFDEKRSGQKFGKKEAVMCLVAIAAFAICCVITLPGLSAAGTKALGIVVSTSILYACAGINSTIVALLLCMLPILTGVMDFGTFAVNVGSSAFLMVMAMMIFATGVVNTNLGKRITFIFLKGMGKSPVGLVFAFAITATVMSALIVTIPVMLILLPIAVGILKELGEKPGESPLGAALMIIITLCSSIGGAALICGSGFNPQGIAILETLSNGQYTISFAQWAAVGIPIAVIATPLCAWLVCKLLKVNNKASKELAPSYIDAQLNELGPMAASEWRFLLTLVLLIIGFLTTGYTGLKTPVVCLLGCIAVCLPGWGVVNAKQAITEMPWDPIFMCIGMQIIAVFSTSTDLATWLCNVLMGWSFGLHECILLVIAGIACVLVTLASCSNPVGIIIPSVVALAAAAGVVPYGLFFAAMFMNSCGPCSVPWFAGTMLTFGPGYWSYKQMAVCGWVCNIVMSIVCGIAIYFIYPLVF